MHGFTFATHTQCNPLALYEKGCCIGQCGTFHSLRHSLFQNLPILFFNLVFKFHIFLLNLHHLARLLSTPTPTLTPPSPDPSQSFCNYCVNYYGHIYE